MKWNLIEKKYFPKVQGTSLSQNGWIQVLVLIKSYMCIPGIAGDSFTYRIAMYKKKEGFYIDGAAVDNVVCWSYLNPIPDKLCRFSQKHANKHRGGK